MKTRPEVSLLICCARTTLERGSVHRIRNLAHKNIEWPLLIKIALQHRVLPLLYRSLNQACPEAVPENVLCELRNHYIANAGRNLNLASALLSLLDFFEAHNIRAIPFKGPAVAMTAYGNVSLRQIGDLDILTQECDYLRARQILVTHGYKIAAEYNWETSLVDGTGRICIDLHRSFTSHEFPIQLDFKRLHKRLRPLRIPGGTTWNGALSLCSQGTVERQDISVLQSI
jgi:hypothetical protein